MGQKSSSPVLSKYEAEAPMQRLSESRISCIRILRVTSDAVAELLLARKLNIHEIVIASTLQPSTQQKIAKYIYQYPNLRRVTIEKTDVFISELLLRALLSAGRVCELTLRGHALSLADCRLLHAIFGEKKVAQRLTEVCMIDCILPYGTSYADIISPLGSGCTIKMSNIVMQGTTT